MRPVEDGGLHAPLLLVDAARGEAPPVVGDEVGDGGEERLHRVVHLHALLPGRADDDGERGLCLRRVVVPAQEAASKSFALKGGYKDSILVLTNFNLDFKVRSQSLHTGISSQIGTKLRDWAVWQARASCYSQAALSSNDSKTQYKIQV